jgi:hypothetical protein
MKKTLFFINNLVYRMGINHRGSAPPLKEKTMTQSQNILEAVKLLTATLSDNADDIIIAMHLREIHRKVEMVDRMIVEQRRGQRQKITA